MTELAFGAYVLDDDPNRIDLDTVHSFLSEDSYWAAGRSRDTVAASFAASARVVGAYHDDELVGFCRVITDGVTVAYLADVFVAPAHRGRGLGTALVDFAIDRGPYATLRWVLHTRDAHGMYEQLGFGAPGDWLMERPTRDG